MACHWSVRLLRNRARDVERPFPVYTLTLAPARRLNFGRTSTRPILSRSFQPPIWVSARPVLSRVTNSRPRGETLCTLTWKTVSFWVGPVVGTIVGPVTATWKALRPLAVVGTGSRKLPLVADSAIVVLATRRTDPSGRSRLRVTVTPRNGVTVPVIATEPPTRTLVAVSWLVSTGVTGAGTNAWGVATSEKPEKSPSPAV